MSTENEQSLLFIYNADSGLFNTLTDIAHKLISPATYACNLCAITHGLLSEKHEWRDYLEQLPMPLEFLHRDEYEQKYGESSWVYPAVLIRKGDTIEMLIPSSDINRCRNVDDLQQLINKNLQ